MPLTDTAIRKAKPSDKPVKLTDGQGLYLLLRPDGARWWRWDYRRPVTGKRNTLSLGTYPDTGLADARAKRDEARRLLAAGADPGEQRKAAKASGQERAANSFEVVAREWLEKQSAVWVPAHSTKILLRLQNDVFPWVGGKRPRTASCRTWVRCSATPSRPAVPTGTRPLTCAVPYLL